MAFLIYKSVDKEDIKIAIYKSHMFARHIKKIKVIESIYK